MLRFNWLTRSKKNVRRLVAVGLFAILFAGMGSHAFLQSQNSDASDDVTWCDVLHHVPHSADCPHNHKPRGPENNLHSEVAHHWILVAELTVPSSGILYRSEDFESSAAEPISRPQTPPFQPPKQA